MRGMISGKLGNDCDGAIGFRQGGRRQGRVR